MAGHKKWSEIRHKATGADLERRQAAADERLQAELDAHAVSLAALRRARSMTQVQLAKALGLSQPQVSRIESQTDLLLSTLRSYIEAVGGELVVMARLPGSEEVELSFEEVLGAPPAAEPEPSVDLMGSAAGRSALRDFMSPKAKARSKKASPAKSGRFVSKKSAKKSPAKKAAAKGRRRS